MKLREKLQSLRKSKGMSQEEMSGRISVSRQAVSKWELGESTPEIDNIVQISNIFNVTIDSLLKDDEELQNHSDKISANHENNITVQILWVASVVFLAIGLFCTFGGWYEKQTAEAVWGGMIIQMVGGAGYYIGGLLSRSKVPFCINFVQYSYSRYICRNIRYCINQRLYYP